MCGFVGIYSYSGQSNFITQKRIKKMTETIRHRGPDDEGNYLSPLIGIGFRRLAVIDVKDGHQPMIYKDNRSHLVLAFNGEIYNFQEIRHELEKKGHQFLTRSDSEVILHGFQEWGENVLQKLRGMFAFIIWDNIKKKLFMARDRIGKKPLYWMQKDGNFYFASEIKAILAGNPTPPNINREAIHTFLTYQYIPGPRTIYKDIYRLPPGHIAWVDSRGILKERRYWSPSVTKKTSMSFNEAKDRIYSEVMEATKVRLIADVPVGAFLSGGIDSSIVVGCMAQFMNRPVKTFSIGFNENDYNELSFAKKVAKHFSTDHNEIIVKSKMMSILPQIVWQYDQPFADASALPSYFVSQATRKHVTVALNGDGGDENFGGYLRYLYDVWFIRMAKIFPKSFRSLFSGVAHQIPESWIHNRLGKKILRGMEVFSKNPHEVNIALLQFFNQEQKNLIYSQEFKKSVFDRPAEDYVMNLYSHGDPKDSLDQVLQADLHSYLPEDLLVKIDVATMTHSLEGRSPFLDHKVIELASSLPSHWKISGRQTKHILKKSFEKFLPKDILYRQKMGFGIPVHEWLRKDYHDTLRGLLLSQESLKRGYFEKKGLAQILDEHRSGKKDHGYRLWALLMLELWHRVCIDKSMSPGDSFS